MCLSFDDLDIRTALLRNIEEKNRGENTGDQHFLLFNTSQNKFHFLDTFSFSFNLNGLDSSLKFCCLVELNHISHLTVSQTTNSRLQTERVRRRQFQI